jgi:UDP-glucose 4-epimerase
LIELCAQGHEVCVLDSFYNSSPEVLKRVSELTQRKIDHYEMDIRSSPDLDRAMAEFRPESVIHFAGLKAVGEGEEIPLEYYAVNVTGTANILAAMQRHGCKRFVFSSSATVYGEPQYLPLDEAHPCAPINVYGRTKYMAELLLDDWQKTVEGASVVVLRYFNPVGAHSSARIGESPRGVPNNLLPFVAQVATGQRPEVKVFGNDYDTPDGTGMRDYIHVDDLAKAHTAALDFSEENKGFNVFNVGTGEAYSVLEIIKEFSRAAGHDVPYQITARRAGDTATSVANPEKSNTTLNWKAQFGLKDMCQAHWNWQHQNPNGYED